MKLANKVAVITGAASGIGKAMAELFAAEGADVVAADYAREPLEIVVQGIKDQGGTVTGVVANVAKEEDVQLMIDTAVTTYGRLDILINNAGITDDFTPVTDVSDDLWDRVIAINLTGPFRACRKAVSIMIAKNGGVIINTASVGGVNGGRGGSAYVASKHALVGLTKNIGYMYADQGIRCVAICPGGVKTNMGLDGKLHPLGGKKLFAGLGTNARDGEAIEIARTALFLASDDASYVNGTTIVVDGGWTAF